MAEIPSIPEFYTNKNIFITGGGGFIGKVLVEKLLRSCPKVNKIYLLLREKKGKSAEERIKGITDLPLFDVVKAQNPNNLSKIKAVNGDVAQIGLGLSPQDRNLLVDEVNIVFHGAASVRFDDSLTDAILLNTRGTREVVTLALEMKNLEVLVHISTTYCNCDKKVIEEKLYPPHADWKKAIEVAENIDKQTLMVLTQKYIHPLPNTYTFSKSLSEHVVYDLCNGRIPVVIYRPSIGWIDNLNGPVGLLTACGKGIIRTVYCDPNLIADYIPVDITVRAMLISTWKQATNRDETGRLTPKFYNGSNNDIQNVTFGHMVEMGRDICSEVPLEDVLWYPDGRPTNCYYVYFLKILFYQLLPALIIDGLLKLLGKRPLLLKIQRRVYVAINELSFFIQNQWKFINDNAYNLQHDLLPCDVEDFAFKEHEVENYEYFKNAAIGAKKFLLHESDDFEGAKRHSRRMWVVAQICNFLWYLGLIWIVFVKFDIVSFAVDTFNEAVEYLTTD